MIAKLRRWLALDSDARSEFSRAWWLLIFAEIGLRSMPFERCASWLQERLEAREGALPSLSPVEVARWVHAAARHHLVPMTCLRRALVVQALLRARAVPAELKLGVRREHGGLVAHAWVEVGNEPVGEDASSLTAFGLLEPTRGNFGGVSGQNAMLHSEDSWGPRTPASDLGGVWSDEGSRIAEG